MINYAINNWHLEIIIIDPFNRAIIINFTEGVQLKTSCTSIINISPENLKNRYNY